MLNFHTNSFLSFLLALTGLTLSAQQATAQSVTLSYTFENVTTGTSSLPAAVSANNASYGPGLTGQTYYTGNPGSAIAGDGWATGTPLNTANNDYFQVSFTATSCYSVVLTNVSWDERKSGTGPSNQEIRYSGNNYATSLFSATVSSTNFETKSGSIGSISIAAGQTVTFRLYGYNATASAGTLRIDNLKFTGTATGDQPSAFMVTGGGLVCPPNGASVGLSGSQTNKTYQLYYNGIASGSPLQGTGNSMDFGLQTGLGTYTVVASNSGGCTTSQTGSAIISTNPNCGGACNINLAVTSSAVSCNGGSNGSINITPGGGSTPYSYDWSYNGPQSPDTDPEDPGGLAAGTYTVTVTDIMNCTKTVSVTISQPAVLNLSSTQINPTGCNATDGSVDLTVAGGTSPFTYDWSNNGEQNPDIDPEDLANLGVGPYTVTVADFNGCTNTRTITLSYIDNVQPTIACPNDATVNAGTACMGMLGSWNATSVSDNCTPNPTVTQSPAASTMLDQGNPTRMVTLIATDLAGNTATCSFMVTLKDATPPSISCPANLSLNTDADCSAVIGDFSPSSLWDNCTVNPGISQSPAAGFVLIGNNASITVVLTASDDAGNSSSCSMTVTLLDAMPPTLVCKVFTAELDANGVANIASGDLVESATDNCGTVNLSSNISSLTCANVNTVNDAVVFANDGNGNSNFCKTRIIVHDPIAPVARCKNAELKLGADGLGEIKPAIINNGTTDNCSFTLTVDPPGLNCENIGQTIVTLIATDESGNSGACTAVVRVSDHSNPVAKCKNPTIYLDDTGHATLDPSQVNNGSSDNCGLSTMTISKTEFNCSEIAGTQTIRMDITDLYGNASYCLSNISVRDVTPPTAVCGNVTVYLNENGQAVVYGADLANQSFDNCSVEVYSPIAKLYTTKEIGQNSLTITVKDGSNNTSTCVSTVTVLPGVGQRSSITDNSGVEFRAFPNPTSGALNMNFKLPAAQKVALRLFDIQGGMVWSQSVEGSEGENAFQVSFETLASGLYLLDFQSEDWRTQTKVSIQK